MQKLITCLWFNHRGQEALDHYAQVFPDFEVLGKSFYTSAGPGKEGDLLTATFSICGVEMMLLDAEPGFDYTTAMSLMVQCEDQAEIDRIWETMLTAGGEEIQCGWIADKFGVQWQIVPRNMEELMSQGDDPEGRARMMQAMFAMKKLDIQALQDAYDGK